MHKHTQTYIRTRTYMCIYARMNTDRQTDRPTDRQTDRPTDRQTEETTSSSRRARASRLASSKSSTAPPIFTSNPTFTSPFSAAMAASKAAATAYLSAGDVTSRCNAPPCPSYVDVRISLCVCVRVHISTYTNIPDRVRGAWRGGVVALMASTPPPRPASAIHTYIV